MGGFAKEGATARASIELLPGAENFGNQLEHQPRFDYLLLRLIYQAGILQKFVCLSTATAPRTSQSSQASCNTSQSPACTTLCCCAQLFDRRMSPGKPISIVTAGNTGGGDTDEQRNGTENESITRDGIDNDNRREVSDNNCTENDTDSGSSQKFTQNEATTKDGMGNNVRTDIITERQQPGIKGKRKSNAIVDDDNQTESTHRARRAWHTSLPVTRHNVLPLTPVPGNPDRYGPFLPVTSVENANSGNSNIASDVSHDSRPNQERNRTLDRPTQLVQAFRTPEQGSRSPQRQHRDVPPLPGADAMSSMFGAEPAQENSESVLPSEDGLGRAFIPLDVNFFQGSELLAPLDTESEDWGENFVPDPLARYYHSQTTIQPRDGLTESFENPSNAFFPPEILQKNDPGVTLNFYTISNGNPGFSNVLQAVPGSGDLTNNSTDRSIHVSAASSSYVGNQIVIPGLEVAVPWQRQVGYFTNNAFSQPNYGIPPQHAMGLPNAYDQPPPVSTPQPTHYQPIYMPQPLIPLPGSTPAPIWVASGAEDAPGWSDLIKQDYSQLQQQQPIQPQPFQPPRPQVANPVYFNGNYRNAPYNAQPGNDNIDQLLEQHYQQQRPFPIQHPLPQNNPFVQYGNQHALSNGQHISTANATRPQPFHQQQAPSTTPHQLGRPNQFPIRSGNGDPGQQRTLQEIMTGLEGGLTRLYQDRRRWGGR